MLIMAAGRYGFAQNRGTPNPRASGTIEPPGFVCSRSCRWIALRVRRPPLTPAFPDRDHVRASERLATRGCPLRHLPQDRPRRDHPFLALTYERGLFPAKQVRERRRLALIHVNVKKFTRQNLIMPFDWGRCSNHVKDSSRPENGCAGRLAFGRSFLWSGVCKDLPAIRGLETGIGCDSCAGQACFRVEWHMCRQHAFGRRCFQDWLLRCIGGH